VAAARGERARGGGGEGGEKTKGTRVVRVSGNRCKELGRARASVCEPKQ